MCASTPIKNWRSTQSTQGFFLLNAKSNARQGSLNLRIKTLDLRLTAQGSLYQRKTLVPAGSWKGTATLRHFEVTFFFRFYSRSVCSSTPMFDATAIKISLCCASDVMIPFIFCLVFVTSCWSATNRASFSSSIGSTSSLFQCLCAKPIKTKDKDPGANQDGFK